MVGLHAAGSVARERQQETLTDLMSGPPAEDGRFCGAKWVGSMAEGPRGAWGPFRSRWSACWREGISYWAVPPPPDWPRSRSWRVRPASACGCRSGPRTVQRATGLWFLVVGLWVGGTLLAAEAAYMEEQSPSRFAVTFPPPEPATLVWDRAVNPLLAWSQLVFRLRNTESSGYDSYRDRWRDGAVGMSQVLPSLLGIAALRPGLGLVPAGAPAVRAREGQG